MPETTYKAIAVPTRLLLHPADPVTHGGDELRRAADGAASMRRSSTQGQTWRDLKDVNLVADASELRVDTYIATSAGAQSTLAMREDGLMLLSDVDDATCGLLCHLAKDAGLHTTFSLAPIAKDVPGTATLLREPREEILGAMKKGPFLDAYTWTNVAHVNDAADVVKRFNIKTGEIAADTDKKADAKAKKAAATKEREKEKEAGAP
jgi:hypothetical protein